MGNIVITEFISLDGVAEAPGGDDNFKYGAWTFEHDRGEEGNKFKWDELDSADALLLGRRTYEGFAAAWPGRDGEFADKFNAMPKHVVSRTLTDPEWNNSTVISGDLAAAVADLKQRYDGDIQVPGSLTLAQTLIEKDLVDQINLMVFPVVLGYGRRFFGETSGPKKLSLASSNVVGDGVLINTLTRRAGQ
ncbi:MAG: dihydrofolate reductase family protein [Solirubrobacterales bacterium]